MVSTLLFIPSDPLSLDPLLGVLPTSQEEGKKIAQLEKKKKKEFSFTTLESRIWKPDPSQSLRSPGIKCCYFWAA
jgi:hypothetical protein